MYSALLGRDRLCKEKAASNGAREIGKYRMGGRGEGEDEKRYTKVPRFMCTLDGYIGLNTDLNYWFRGDFRRRNARRVKIFAASEI